jgi:hypothetical protein
MKGRINDQKMIATERKGKGGELLAASCGQRRAVQKKEGHVAAQGESHLPELPVREGEREKIVDRPQRESGIGGTTTQACPGRYLFVQM